MSSSSQSSTSTDVEEGLTLQPKFDSAGLVTCITTDANTGMLLITQVRLPAHGARGRSARMRDEIREGWSWLWAHAAVRTLAITIFTFNVTFGAAWSVLVLYSRERLGLGAVGFGLISTAIAVGWSPRCGASPRRSGSPSPDLL